MYVSADYFSGGLAEMDKRPALSLVRRRSGATKGVRFPLTILPRDSILYSGDDPMTLYESTDAPDNDADLAVTLRDDSLSPWFESGETVYLRRSTELLDGDVGLFCSSRGMVFRQFCQDSQGNFYLFAVNRARRTDDLLIPARRAGELVCYGKVILPRPIPLPDD